MAHSLPHQGVEPKEFHYHLTQQDIYGDCISRLFLKPQNEILQYEAGQYINVVHANSSVSPLSIACAPHFSEEIEIHLSHPLENLPAQDILSLLKKEKKLLLQGPYGECVFSKLDLHRPIIFVMRETGFAPVKAIVEKIITDKLPSQLYFYWCGENYASDLMNDWLRDQTYWEYTQVLSHNVSELVRYDFSDLTHHQVYAVDAANRVYDLLFELMEQGLAKEDFFSDMVNPDAQ